LIFLLLAFFTRFAVGSGTLSSCRFLSEDDGVEENVSNDEDDDDDDDDELLAISM